MTDLCPNCRQMFDNWPNPICPHCHSTPIAPAGSVITTARGNGPPAVILPEVFSWSKIGKEAHQLLPNILRRKEHERRCGNHEVWWGVGERDVKRRIDGLVNKNQEEPQIFLIPDRTALGYMNRLRKNSGPTQSPRPATPVRVWRKYNSENGPIPLPEHVLMTSIVADPNKPRALVFRCEHPLTDALAKHDLEFLYLNQTCNLLTGNENYGQQVTVAVRRKDPLPLPVGTPYPIYVRAVLVQPYVVTLEDPREKPLDESEFDRVDQIGCKNLDCKEWKKFVCEIRCD
jgi:hypothetical protein